MRTCVFFVLFFSSLFSYSQSSIWNSNSMMFSKDTASLEDMSTASILPYNNSFLSATDLISLPSDLSFRFGLNSYTSFSVSAYGYLRLGTAVTDFSPETQDNVISLVYNTTFFATVKYKITGSAPNRKIVIQWSGTMQPSGEQITFQAWLWETTGKIQFVYSGIRGYYNSAWGYKTFCRTTILQKNTIISLQVRANNALPSIAYNTVLRSADSIYTKTCYTFQPDTTKPNTPSNLAFSNIAPGCLTVSFDDNSSNESIFELDRADDGVSFKPESYLYISSPLNNTVQSYNQAKLQPFWNYTYRVFASNGFINSDTIVASVQTLMPEINGVKKIPGDYPSITALLQDAPCKHIGPNLVIELQSNYNSSNENWPVYFKPSMQNWLIQSIKIRPAAGADLSIIKSSRNGLFIIDSVRHVEFDGRAGGTGTAINLKLKQQLPNFPAIRYINGADSGGINYCDISIPNYVAANNVAISVTNIDTTFKIRRGVNSFSLTNSIVHAESGVVPSLFYAQTEDTTMSGGFSILNNQFYGFTKDAVHFSKGGSNSLIKGNSFYQVSPILLDGFVNDVGSCIRLQQAENMIIDNNYFGGSGPNLQGAYKFGFTWIRNYSFIHYVTTSPGKTCLIRNNKFGNIQVSGSGATKLIYASGGEVVVENNKIGTTDSLASITGAGVIMAADMWYGKKYFKHNFISGLHSFYPNVNYGTGSYLVSTSWTDSAYIGGNDIGGADNVMANTNGGGLSGITGAVNRVAVIKDNIIHGLSSREGEVCGIDFEIASTDAKESLIVDSNKVHHLLGGKTTKGITANLNSFTLNRVSGNRIYGLMVKDAPSTSSYYTLRIVGINVSQYNWGTVRPPAGEIQIFNNDIHSFSLAGTTTATNLDGIYVSGNLLKVYNNVVRLGHTMTGQLTESVASLSGIWSDGNVNYVEHNSIYLGGRSTFGKAFNLLSQPAGPGVKTLFAVNNIAQFEPNSVGPFNFSYFNTLSNRAVSARNIWFSSIDPTVVTRLNDYKRDCQCDSSSFIGNPKFINPSADSALVDLHLQPGSAAKSAGTVSVLQITKDIDGETRNGLKPDVGADESMPVLPPEAACKCECRVFSASIINGAFYQWQVDKGAGFENITDDSIYVGTRSEYLYVRNVPNSWMNYKYRCLITDGGSITYTPVEPLTFIYVWTGAVSNLWNEASNWSCNKIPDENTHAIVNAGPINYPHVTINTTVRSLTVQSGASVTVTSGVTLTVLH